MFYNTAIESRLDGALTTKDYENHYVFSSALVGNGFDGHDEYYFLVRESYEEIEKELIKLHELYKEDSDVFKKYLITPVEDPVMMSSDHKYLIYVRREFGHFILNTLISVMAAHSVEPDAIFVFFVDVPDEKDEELKKVIRFLERVLSNHGINYYFLRCSHFMETFNVGEMNARSPVVRKFPTIATDDGLLSHYLAYRAINMSVIDSGHTTSRMTARDIKSLIDKYINDYSDYSDYQNRKIYITRRLYETVDTAITDEGYISSSKRIYQEDLLEEYLQSKGFEIIDFSSLPDIQDQINIMRGTSVLIGATGTGLTNMLFMPDSRVVLELRVELGGDGNSSHWIPTEYYYLANAKDHVHVLVGVKDKQANTAVKKLKNILDNFDLNLINQRTDI